MKAPNFIVFLTDDQGYGDLSCMGATDFCTPHLDRLAREGARFTDWYSNSPVCSPSRASLLTGRYPGNAGVRAILAGHRTTTGLPPQVPTLATALKKLGYRTYMSGKWHLGLAEGSRPPSHGFDHWYGFMAGCIDYYSHIFYWGMNNPGPGINPTHDLWEDDREIWDNGRYFTETLVERAIDYLRQAAKVEKPFFLYVPFNAPHYPMHAPQKYVDRFDIESLPEPLFRETDLAAQQRLADINFQTKVKRPTYPKAKLKLAKYWAQIELIDENIGRILESLEKSGQRENTVIIFTSDHGEMAGDHGLNKKGCRFYEGLVRVPLIFSWPGHIKQGLKSDALVELVDIAPTLLELTGHAVPKEMQGKSLLPIIEGKTDPGFHRQFVRSVYYKVLNGPESYATMLRTRRYKIVNYHGHDLGELFDLEKDPNEFNNLWDNPAHADIRFELMKKNFDALALAVDTGPPRVGRY